jgi:rhodanese-related sulfurtransferase
MAPYAFHAGGIVEFVVFLLIGMAFGGVLEMSGFGDSRKLAAQFYLREMTVLKVMFTSIIVAAVLIHLAAALELLDLQRVWVNPTYLWPGIAGGLVMGVGFIVGGFCPGTSLVAAATLKLDGIFFVVGGLCGVFAFGETVGGFDTWWHSSFLGRFTLADWLGIPTGVAVLALVLMALAMFVLGEAAERRFAGAGVGETRSAGDAAAGVRSTRSHRGAALLAAGALAALAGLVALLGQPTVADRWRWIEPRAGADLSSRAFHVDPGEVVELRRDISLAVRVLEVRSEADYNLFHLEGSRRIDLADATDPAFVRELQGRPDNHIVFLASNGERDAAEAWKRMRAQGVINLYIVEGGINGWLAAYPPSPCVAIPVGEDDEALAWRFLVSAGDRIPSAHPELARHEPAIDCGAARPAAAGGEPAWFDGREVPARAYEKKVVLQRKVVAKGGCG